MSDTLKERFHAIYLETTPDIHPEDDPLYGKLWEMFRIGFDIGYNFGMQNLPYEGDQHGT